MPALPDATEHGRPAKLGNKKRRASIAACHSGASCPADVHPPQPGFGRFWRKADVSI
jgi:hypothetical protein